jgi:hypothetical protein
MPGATRVCPHCKATVLESAAVCPGCRHHLRFSSTGAQVVAPEGYNSLNFESTIRHSSPTEACEYCVVVTVRGERGEQISRQVVGVGALQPGESRGVAVTVEMLPQRVVAPPPPAAVKPASPPPKPTTTPANPAANVGIPSFARSKPGLKGSR